MHFIKIFLLSSLVPLAAEGQTAATDSLASKDSADARAQELKTVAIHEKGASKARYRVEKITSATKTSTPLRDVPQSISVISKTVLSDQAVQSLAEVSRYIPGVTFGQGEGHRDAPTIRGNASTADFFLDGVRDDAQYHRDIYNTERVEALKGSNAMTFGRGGGGGVINRVSKVAEWRTNRAVVFEGGSANHRRGTFDFGDGMSSGFAARVTGVAENSGSFRNSTNLSRRGINPTMALLLGDNVIRGSYERFLDNRTVDRGIPSFQGRPSKTSLYQFFGDPSVNRASLDAHNGNLTFEREWASRLTVRNRTQGSSYQKSYQNVLPGAVSTDGSKVTLTGYRNSHERSSLFNQTDIILESRSGRLANSLLLGSEFGKQKTDNYRETGFFGTATSRQVAFASPSIVSGVEFRQSSTDADNRVRTGTSSIYLQDQVSLGSMWQAIAGVRREDFEIRFHNNRNSANLSRRDRMISPRAGLVFKPLTVMSLYGSLSVSHLPSSGDQFSSLTATTATLKPERFTNREIGFKWDIGDAVALSSSLYKLSRENTSAPDPVDPTRIVQTGKQESKGFEGNISGSITSRWNVIVGFANQSARIVQRTSASPAGANVPQVPARSASFWSRYDVSPRVGVGVGVVAQSTMFAAIDNSVVLPGFARTDAALFLLPVSNFRIQANVENVFNVRYFANSQGNNNIMPGTPRTLRVSVRVF